MRHTFVNGLGLQPDYGRAAPQLRRRELAVVRLHMFPIYSTAQNTTECSCGTVFLFCFPVPVFAFSPPFFHARSGLARHSNKVDFLFPFSVVRVILRLFEISCCVRPKEKRRWKSETASRAGYAPAQSLPPGPSGASASPPGSDCALRDPEKISPFQAQVIEQYGF